MKKKFLTSLILLALIFLGGGTLYKIQNEISAQILEPLPPTETSTETLSPSSTETTTTTTDTTITESPIPTETPMPIPSPTESPIPTETPMPIPSPTESPTPTETPTPTPSPTESPTPTETPMPTPSPSPDLCSYSNASCTRVACPLNKTCVVDISTSGNLSCICCVPKNGDCNNSSNNCCPHLDLDCIAGKCKLPPCTGDMDCTNRRKPHCCIPEGDTTGICGQCCEEAHCLRCETCIDFEWNGNQNFCYPKQLRDGEHYCSPRFSCPSGKRCNTTPERPYGVCLCVPDSTSTTFSSDIIPTETSAETLSPSSTETTTTTDTTITESPTPTETSTETLSPSSTETTTTTDTTITESPTPMPIPSPTESPIPTETPL